MDGGKIAFKRTIAADHLAQPPPLRHSGRRAQRGPHTITLHLHSSRTGRAMYDNDDASATQRMIISFEHICFAIYKKILNTLNTLKQSRESSQKNDIKTQFNQVL